MLRTHPAAPPKQGRLAPVPSIRTPTSTVLLTGFSPFGGAATNASWLVARSLHDSTIGGHTIVSAELPTEFDRSLESLSDLMQAARPALVVCLGQAGGRAAISLERVAINVADARIADNAGEQPVDTPVVSGGPAAYFTGLPIKAMLQALQRAGLAAEVSQSAGTFVCNHVFYGLMHALERRRALKGVRGGFIHLPYLPGQGTPHMAFTDMQRGVQIAIGAALATLQDLKLAAGAEH